MDGSKIKTQQEIREVADLQRRLGKTIVFTNGCFDILHAGHTAYLAEAAGLGDVLVLGLNSDLSVRGIKGVTRPVTPEDQRAAVLAALACIDYIVLFDRPDPEELIHIVRPDILVKGADWGEEEIIGGNFVKKMGGRVARIPLKKGISTSLIIEKILKTCG